jgi:hypothetical protein
MTMISQNITVNVQHLQKQRKSTVYMELVERKDNSLTQEVKHNHHKHPSFHDAKAALHSNPGAICTKHLSADL